MAFSLNRAQLIGNITRDPEMRTTPNGTAVTSFSVATNFSWTDKNGQKQDKVEFHNIVAWARLAEIIHQYAHKGTKVFVEGRIETRDWEGEDGVKRYRTEIIADNFIILDSKGNPTSIQPPAAAATPPAQAPQSIKKAEEPAPQEQHVSDEVSIDDLPF
ncbi:single-stranded DNA-binding protein [Candidatus Peregrinibacteria bacterium CG11_big_fil_rev_8_21_14_0_20_41_10]|nr:MAG: single-stranded DNA-binding protein [Candidatus Peregrinibacteria bacterium CG11_big_fil_rev_8_21_14_0_20_41_10]